MITRCLSFTLSGIAFDDVDNAPGGAFEVALIDANTGLSLLGSTGLTRNDAILNLQADGEQEISDCLERAAGHTPLERGFSPLLNGTGRNPGFFGRGSKLRALSTGGVSNRSGFRDERPDHDARTFAVSFLPLTRRGQEGFSAVKFEFFT